MKAIVKFSALAAAIASLAAVSCKKEEDKPQKEQYEADIIISFTAKNPAGTVFQGEIGKDTVYLKINPYLDPEEELKGCVPTFFISSGASVVPDASEPQDFGVKGGVKYTVTSYDGAKVHEYIVTWKASDKKPYGEGFSYCEITDGVNADNSNTADGPMGGVTPFNTLGWEGTRMDYYLPDGSGEKDSKLYGDLDCYIGYCGKHIVLFSRRYALEGDTQNATNVVHRDRLTPEGKLSLGSIDVTLMQTLANDWYGHLVAVVDKGDINEIYYWTDPFKDPVLLGTTTANLTPFAGDNEDCGNNLQVAGDITADAYITAQAPRSAEGEHYMLTVKGGVLSSEVEIIASGYESDDTGGWQMISIASDTIPCEEPDYILCDNTGELGANHGNQIYINTFDGITIGEVANPLLQNNLQTWWVGNGPSLYRTGAHRPYVSAMLINGKQYALFVGGSMWWQAMAVLEYDMDLSTLAHENANVAAYTGTLGWSYGGLGAWYWDREEEAGYVAAWWGRAGLVTRKLTCYE